MRCRRIYPAGVGLRTASGAPRRPRLGRMRKLTVEQEGAVGAQAQLVYRLITDDEHHQRFLPTEFSDFKVLE